MLPLSALGVVVADTVLPPPRDNSAAIRRLTPLPLGFTNIKSPYGVVAQLGNVGIGFVTSVFVGFVQEAVDATAAPIVR